MSICKNRGPAKRAAILEAAKALFLEKGYEAVSVDAIAQEAGVSKATLYAHFPGKDQLFSAIIRERCEAQFAPRLPEAEIRADPRAALELFGQRFVALVSAPESLAVFRLVIAESPRFPELGPAFYDAAPHLTLQTLTGYFAAWHQEGLLSVPTPERAADQFVGMLKGQWYLKMAMGIGDPPPATELDALVADAATAIVRAYARPGAPASRAR